MLTLLASGVRHTSTHPLTGLKGWESTHVDKRTLIVHQKRDEGLYVGYIGGQHNYGAAHRRLGSLNLMEHFGAASPRAEHYFTDDYHGNPNISFKDFGDELNIEPHHVNDPAHDRMKKSPYNDRVTIPHSERVNVSQPNVHTRGVHQYLDEPDHEPIHVAHDPEFDDYTVLEGHHRLVADRLAGRDTEAYVAKAGSSKTAEKAPDWAEDHAWLPHDRIFSGGKGGVDPRLFDTETRIMHPAVKKTLIDAIDGLWAKYDPNWQRWARVYLAGSEASEWWGNNDFDCLIGIDHDRARQAVIDWAGITDDALDAHLTQELRENLNTEDYIAPWDGEVWHQTFFVNPNSYDIRKIKPYAAYDITRDLWAVDPVKADKDWGPTKLPEALFSEGEGLVKQIDAIERLDDTQRTGRGAALWDYLHNDRRRAFSDEGEGVFDTGNAVWKYLDMHPSQPLTRLLKMKSEAVKKRRIEEAA
jgi:hypothetical protein